MCVCVCVYMKYIPLGIFWTNAGILLIVPLGTNFNEILSEIHTFS